MASLVCSNETSHSSQSKLCWKLTFPTTPKDATRSWKISSVRDFSLARLFHFPFPDMITGLAFFRYILYLFDLIYSLSIMDLPTEKMNIDNPLFMEDILSVLVQEKFSGSWKPRSLVDGLSLNLHQYCYQKNRVSVSIRVHRKDVLLTAAFSRLYHG